MLFPTAECIVCSKSDNPTKKCRISDILSVRPIMNHKHLSYFNIAMWLLIPAVFRGKLHFY